MVTNPNLIRDLLPADRNLPTKAMKYAAQVVWCIDPGDSDMLCMAEGLHGKRVAKGEGDLSQMVFGLSPDWPVLPGTTDNIRLYVIAHGVNVSGVGTPTVKIAIGHPVSATTTTFRS